ncbi:PREDICTED: leucine-rich repeat extensin-like protein 5 [Vollenhovia emeryi]|uniref:leucine-rich repeat extensin-like protein 5 n=1 Tax=Vollenhovia emeryi TaxID=411798 RepID=UPI0005F3998F|nr:PREDICTED: leucine-rich repeat extensin-like protein 5 [Vollenhovia emeryi]
MTNMIVKHFFLVLAITLLLYVGNSEAGWKFWKKEETTTTTTTTTTTIPSVQSVTPRATIIGGPTVPAINPANSGPTIGQNGAQQNVRNNARPNRPNPGTEVGLDIVAPRPNSPGIGGGNGQTYRDWAVDFAGAGEPARNQPSRTPGQGLAINGDQTRPNSSTDSRPTLVSGNIPIQPTQPSVAGSRNTPQPLPQSTSTVPKPTSVQSVHPHITPGSTTATPPARIDQNNRPNRWTYSGPTWADIVAELLGICASGGGCFCF